QELSKTGKVVLSQNQVLQHMGQLFALRHLINLSSDLLDIPDFYWEHEELEQLYRRVSNHLNVSKRTSVMNVKLSHCVELMELLKSHLNEEHSSRLEWIIIILIMVEVGFELLHFMERLF
ncbi:required for meiotic nuclear division protein 1 homolog, partial [Homarus americanus]|uniref:required for meiotic nuclear division protein 1 homolog n=1 Tax=Homarus americanus TaxID=6706 RepID=UPI001C496EE4